MARYQSPVDAPNLLRSEAQQIALTFTKLSPTTGRISWNIPAPAHGCDVNTQAYNGIVITVDTVAASKNTTPQNTNTYVADPTFDSNLHAGSRIGTALVVGAFYDDKETTFVDISNITPNTPIYVSGYAVDKQLRYHKEGNHAYSLPYGNETGNLREKLPAYQIVLLGLVDNTSLFDIFNLDIGPGQSTGANAGDPTGLTVGQNYTFKIFFDKCDKEGTIVTINGTDAQTYGDLVQALTTVMMVLNNPPLNAGRPNVNGIYLNTTQQTVYIWDGNEHTIQPTIPFPTDPSVINLNEFWFNPTTTTLKQWNGTSWATLQYLNSVKDPVGEIDQSTYWYNGSLVRKWNGVVWCDVTTFSQENDPSLPNYPSDDTYWFNTATGVLNKWKQDCKQWVTVEAIHDPNDPALITSGSYWFNYEIETLYVYNGSMWLEHGNYEASETAPTVVSVNKAWFNTSTDTLSVWNGSSWVPTDVTVYHSDPTDRESCQLWWDSNDDLLYVWTYASPTGWVQVTNFIQSPTDPAATPLLAAGTAWFVPSTQKLFTWDGIDWNEQNVIIKPSSPNLPALNDIWYNGTVWKQWNGTTWTTFVPFVSELDRSTISTGTFWYNTTTPSLRVWNGLSWVSVTYQTTPYTPAIGYQYFDTTDNTLYTWSTTGWVADVGPVYAILNDQGNIVFITTEIGSNAYVNVEDIDLFQALNVGIGIKPMEPGRDEIPGAQGYQLEGVGTDGSSDERKLLHKDILEQLGAPAFTVELTPSQLDICIRQALEEFRRKSASAYKRGFFFLNIVPGRQIYELTDKTVGFHKVVRVMAAYRIQSSFLGNATGQGAYGQAMLQHLYQMGSFDLISYHIMSDYVELMNMMFAANLVFHFDEDQRKLQFHQTFGSNERVLLDVTVERTEQELMRDRTAKLWIERYALGKAMLILAEIRGKYSSLPGAGGGITLNSQDLRSAGKELIDQCYMEIDDYTANEIEMLGHTADFILG